MLKISVSQAAAEALLDFTTMEYCVMVLLNESVCRYMP